MSLVNQKIRALAERVAASHGLDVVDLEFAGGSGKHRALRIFLERDAAGRAVLEQRLAAIRADAAAQHPGADTAEADEDGADELEDELEDDAEGEFDEEDASSAEDEPEDEAGEDDGEAAAPGAIVLDMVDAGEAAGLTPEEDELAYLREVPAGVPVEQLSGITHGDCERFSRDFGTALDVEDLVPGAEYLLEASSPGLDRKLSKPEEFRRFAGLLCKVQTFTPIAGNRHWQGHLGAVTADAVTLIPVKPKGSGRKKKKDAAAPEGNVEIAFANVEKAQLVPEF